MFSGVLPWLVVVGTGLVATIALVGPTLFAYYTDETVAVLRALAGEHPDLQMVGWEPFVRGHWKGASVRVRVIRDHGAAERFNFRTGTITRIEVHVPDEGEARGERTSPIPEEALPDAEGVAPPSAGYANLFGAPMGIVFEMEGAPETVDAWVGLLDALVRVGT